ncbi:dynein heavy chain domain-containing 1-like [Brachionus plicatilis]|uniref:Dynein heavy chain domain-containing 1-like n=1 Tax=Brachionus plicatilis TaxID=10195 RepID=A0A3M7T5B1_BRAPC|nr:dynein heavy chain domain-containing 1-like [Brachionus plicatilis]
MIIFFWSHKFIFEPSKRSRFVEKKLNLKKPNSSLFLCPLTSQKKNPKNQRVHTVPFYSLNCGLKTYFEEPYDEEFDKIPIFEDMSTIGSSLKFKGTRPKSSGQKPDDDELKRIEDAINYGTNKPDLHYKRSYLGYIRFMGRIVRINPNLACFITSNSYKKLPENLKCCIRNVRIIEPDLKQITIGLLISQGMNQGLTDVEILAKKILDFLSILPAIVYIKIPNEFVKKCKSIGTISKIIKLSAIKYRQDKGRQERVLGLNISCLFSPNFTTANDKVLFNSLLKKIFDYEATNFIEDTLTNLIKAQMSDNGLRINNKQIQKRIN